MKQETVHPCVVGMYNVALPRCHTHDAVMTYSPIAACVVVQEVISSIVSCYCYRVHSLDDATMQARLAKDSIFDTMAEALTAGTAIQMAQLMQETGQLS